MAAKKKPAKRRRDPKAAKIAAAKARLLDIAAGVCGTATAEYGSWLETNCVQDALSVGKYLAAVYVCFDVPPNDHLRSLAWVEDLVDFDTAAKALAEMEARRGS